MGSAHIPITLFVILLAGSVHNMDPAGFDGFVQRLEAIIGGSSSSGLPFIVKDHVIDKLKKTPYDFKDHCYRYDYQSLQQEGQYSPVSSLKKAIVLLFYYYKQSANKKSDTLEVIESMDPIGFLVYLAKKNIDEKSPNLPKAVDRFAKEMYEKFPLEGSNYNLGDFMEFLQRLEKSIEGSSANDLPFKKKQGVIESLKETTDEFKDLCLRYQKQFKQENGSYSPLATLNQTIYYFFYYYKKSAKEKGSENIVEEIESTDPVGFCAYLNKKHENQDSPTFVQSAKQFQNLMHTNLHITDSGKYTHSDFDEFLQRLETSMKSSSLDVLPFMAKHNLFERLKETSGSFKELCIGFDAEAKWMNGDYSPILSLSRSIESVFCDYQNSCGGNYIKNLKKIKLADPIGFNIHLTKHNVSETSSSVKDFVDDFHQTMYEKAPIISTSYHLSDFMEFIERIKNATAASSLDILPFTLKVRVSKTLMQVSTEFMKLCLSNDFEAKRKYKKFSSISSLEKTIKSIFSDYKKSSKKNRRVLEEMEAMDPIGFHVYITKRDIKVSSSTFAHSIKDFQTTLSERVQLFKSRTDYSYIDVYDRNKGLYEITEVVRTAVTSEYKPFCRFTIDFFADLAMQQFPDIKFYYLQDYDDLSKYKRHRSKSINDVQILYGFPGAYEGAHAICIQYQASSRNVLVYDSKIFENLDPTQRKIIDILYPFKRDIVYMTPKTSQDETPTCAVFSVIYATMLLLGYDPAEHSIKLNHVFGDDTLYMRLHIMNMFANRKLTMMK